MGWYWEGMGGRFSAAKCNCKRRLALGGFFWVGVGWILLGRVLQAKNRPTPCGFFAGGNYTRMAPKWRELPFSTNVPFRRDAVCERGGAIPGGERLVPRRRSSFEQAAITRQYPALARVGLRPTLERVVGGLWRLERVEGGMCRVGAWPGGLAEGNANRHRL